MDTNHLTAVLGVLVVLGIVLWLAAVASERQARRTLAIVVRRLRDCERRLDWWAANGVIDLNDGKGPRRQGYSRNTLGSLEKNEIATEFDDDD
jgi:hypothetical protein